MCLSLRTLFYGVLLRVRPRPRLSVCWLPELASVLADQNCEIVLRLGVPGGVPTGAQSWMHCVFNLVLVLQGWLSRLWLAAACVWSWQGAACLYKLSIGCIRLLGSALLWQLFNIIPPPAPAC